MSLDQLQLIKEQVRQATDIVDLVGSYISLRRQGARFLGICPWHDDARPSLQVNPDRQSWKCWPCDIGGDVFSFVMRAEGLEFREALELLAERAGIATTPTGSERSTSDAKFSRRNLLRATAWAETLFHQQLLTSAAAEPARRYLQQRGINNDSIERFRLGFAPAEWEWLLGCAAEVNASPEVLQRVGLLAERDSGGYYDRFRGRLIFPIRDSQSRPIAFGGRVLPELSRENDAKYINSPETPLFSKSSQLYALDAARTGVAREQGVVVMEGYTDVIMAHQYGVDHAVAVLGTALGEKHVPLIRRFTDSITLVLDGDAAGQRRTLDILDNLLALFVKFEIELRILTLPEGSDPCDVIRSQGSDEFRRLLAQSVDALQHKVNAVTNGLAPTTDTHRATQAVESILATLARALPARASATSPALLREEQIITQLAKQFGLAAQSLVARLMELRGAQRNRLKEDSPAESTTDEMRSAASPWERELIELLLSDPSLAETFTNQIDEVDVECPAAREIFVAAVALQNEHAEPTYDRLMLRLSEPAKCLLVDCDMRAREKSESDSGQRLRDLLSGLEQRRVEARHQAAIAELNVKRLDPEHELETLTQIYDDLKRKEATKRR